ncbi:MAG: hypothetical protein DRN66_02710 [Candidatus Nanohalarchaeota archaeon]|nr:MAG: hypothetical protein DRN66_02710 [Candidatus Nanohaloarchaeota archaeon]
MESDISFKTQAKTEHDEMKMRENVISLQKYEKMLSNVMYTREKMNLDIKGIDISLKELEKKPKEVYRFYGMILLKKSSEEMEKELEEEKENILLKQKQLLKQEETIKKMYAELRQKVIESQKQMRGKYPKQ